MTAAALGLCSAPAAAKSPLSAQEAKQYREAQSALEHDAERAYRLSLKLGKLPHAQDMALKLRADAALRTGRVREAIQYYKAFAEETTDSMAAFRANLDAAELMALAGNLSASATLLQTLDDQHNRLRGRVATLRHLGARVVRMRHDIAQAQAKKGDRGKEAAARNFAAHLMRHYPNESSTRREGLALKPSELSDDARFHRAISFYRSWAYQSAREEFRRFEKEGSSRGESARWHLAQIALNKLRDDPKEAERLFGKLRKKGKYREESTYQYARSLMRQERYDDALAVMDEYEEEYPRGKRIELIYYYRGWLPYDHRENDKAIAGFDRYLKKYGRRGRRRSYIRGFRAWAFMRKKAWKEAIEAYDELIKNHKNPLVDGKGLYWQAYAHWKLREKRAALKKLRTLRRAYPVSYYGMLGEQLRARILKKDPRASKVWWPKHAGTYPTKATRDVNTIDVTKLPETIAAQFQRVKVLVELGEQREARRALSPIYNALLRELPSSEREEWIFALGEYVGDYNRMWRVATGASISRLLPVPDRRKRRSAMGYPRAYPKVSANVSKEFDLPVYIIWSIMRQESRYRPSAISHTDAVGALQMIPKTARLIARDTGMEYNLRTFHHPEVGFRFSAFYMKKLLDTFGGLYVPMASSYNSGPTVVARWFRRNPKASFPWLIEEFEYNEGRNYGRKVAEHMLRYIYLYEKDPKVRAKLLDQLFPVSRNIKLPKDVGY